MKLFRISQDKNNDYDTYDSAVVCAETEEQARFIHPRYQIDDKEWNGKVDVYDSWVDAENVKVEYIGEAKEGMVKGVICASFNAG